MVSLCPATNTKKSVFLSLKNLSLVLLRQLIQSHAQRTSEKESKAKIKFQKVCWNTLSPLILSSPIWTHPVFTFYCRTLVLMSMPTVLQPLCGSCWLVVQSHRHFITNQSLFAFPNKQRYRSYHRAMCLHLGTQVTLSCFVCALLKFLQIQDLLSGLHSIMNAFTFAVVRRYSWEKWYDSQEVLNTQLKLW